MSVVAIGTDGTVKIIDRKGVSTLDFAIEYFGDTDFEGCSLPRAVQQEIGAHGCAMGAYVQVDDGLYNKIGAYLIQSPPTGGKLVVWDDNDETDNLHKLKKHLDERFGGN